MSSAESPSKTDVSRDALHAIEPIRNNAIEEVNQSYGTEPALAAAKDVLANLSRELVQLGFIPELWIGNTAEIVQQPPDVAQAKDEVLPPGMQHSVNAKGEEVYTLSNGLQITKSGEDLCTVVDANGRPLGRISADQFENIQGSDSLNLTLMDAAGYVTVNEAGETLVTYANGTEIKSDRNGQTVFASFRNGAHISKTDEGTYVYDNGQGTSFTMLSMPSIASDGSLKVMGQTADGRVVELAITGSAFTETITSQSDHGTNTTTNYQNGISVHNWIDSQDVAQQAIVINDHVNLTRLSNGSYQLLIDGRPTNISAEHVTEPDATGQIKFSIEGHLCAVNSQGQLIYDFGTENAVTLSSTSFVEPLLTLSGTNANGELESVVVSPSGHVEIETGPSLNQFEKPQSVEHPEGTDGSGDPEIDKELKILSDLAKQRYSGTELAAFLQNLDLLEKRYKDKHFNKAELMETFKSVEKLMALNANEMAISPAKRDRLVWEELAIMADGPRYINQGIYNTCTVTSSLEVMASRYPSAVADTMLQLATTGGEYTAPDGTKIKIDMTPYGQSLTYPTPDGDRNYCVQLMNVLMMNIGLQKIGLNTYEYRQDADGEGLWDVSDPSHPKKILSHFGLEGNEMEKVITAMVGAVDGPLILDFKGNGAGAPATEQFETVDELRGYLEKIRDKNGFPIVVGVNTFNPPFSTGNPGGHVVTIEGYDPGPPERVLINNTWGQANDFLGKKAISLEEAFYMCMPPERPEQIEFWQRIVNEDHKQNLFVLDHELQLLEFEAHQGTLTVQQRIGAIEDLYERAFDYWDKQKKSGHQDDSKRASDFYRLKCICLGLPTEQALQVFDNVYHSGYINPYDYEMELGKVVMNAIREQASDRLLRHSYDNTKFNATLSLVKHYVELLEPGDRAYFQMNMKRWLEEAGFQGMVPDEFGILLPTPSQSTSAPPPISSTGPAPPTGETGDLEGGTARSSED